MSDRTHLGSKVRRLRRAQGVTQVEMAKRLGISPSYLNLIEHNQRPLTRPLQMKLAEGYDVDLHVFAEDEDARIVADISPTRCSLAGIHAGLYYAETPHIFVSACDTPFLNLDLVRYLAEAMKPPLQVVIPETSAGIEALCAVYAKTCLKAIEENLARNRFAIRAFFKPSRTRRIPEHVLRKFDPDLDSFFNINTPEDLARAEQMAAAGHPALAPRI